MKRLKFIRFFSASTPKTLTLMAGVLFLAIIFQAQLAQQSPQNNATPSQIAQTQDVTPLSSEEQKFLELLNEYRKNNGLILLKPSETLTNASRWMANDMREHVRVSHIDSLNRNPKERFLAFNYSAPIMGENVNYNTNQSADAAFNDFKKSTKGHNEQMLTPQHRAIGIGKAGGYWAIGFGSVLDKELIGSPTSTPTQTTTPTVSTTQIPTTTTQPTATATLTAAPTGNKNLTVNLGVSLPGIGTGTSLNSQPRNQRTVTVTLFDATGNPAGKTTGILSYNNGVYSGVVEFKNIPEGIFDLGIALDNTLTARPLGFVNTANQNNYTTPNMQLVTGDIVQNNKLDVFDYNALLRCYNNGSCADKQLADLNDDGIIDGKDVNILLRSFSVQR